MAENKLIVGLGNPGANYQRNRHNIGFVLVDMLAESLQLSWRPSAKFQGEYALWRSDYGNVHLLKPMTYMNLSGRSVGACARYFHIATEQILVAHDEIDFPPLRLRLKYSGGSGGHNGLNDLVKHMGSADFWRLRIGVGRPANKTEVKNYVLANFSQAEQQQLNVQLLDAFACVHLWAQGQMALAQQKIAMLGN